MNNKQKLIDVEELAYEEAFSELVSIVESLEKNEHTLDGSMRLFERGQALSLRCARLLEMAELKVQQLIGENLIDLDID